MGTLRNNKDDFKAVLKILDEREEAMSYIVGPEEDLAAYKKRVESGEVPPPCGNYAKVRTMQVFTDIILKLPGAKSADDIKDIKKFQTTEEKWIKEVIGVVKATVADVDKRVKKAKKHDSKNSPGAGQAANAKPAVAVQKTDGAASAIFSCNIQEVRAVDLSALNLDEVDVMKMPYMVNIGDVTKELGDEAMKCLQDFENEFNSSTMRTQKGRATGTFVEDYLEPFDILLRKVVHPKYLWPVETDETQVEETQVSKLNIRSPKSFAIAKNVCVGAMEASVPLHYRNSFSFSSSSFRLPSLSCAAGLHVFP